MGTGLRTPIQATMPHVPCLVLTEILGGRTASEQGSSGPPSACPQSKTQMEPALIGSRRYGVWPASPVSQSTKGMVQSNVAGAIFIRDDVLPGTFGPACLRIPRRSLIPRVRRFIGTIQIGRSFVSGTVRRHVADSER
jgi:hypothetical protein